MSFPPSFDPSNLPLNLPIPSGDGKHAVGGHGPMLLAVDWTLNCVVIVIYGLRCWAATRDRRSGFRWDLLWSGIATLSVVIAGGPLTKAVKSGAGNHIMALNFDQVRQVVRWSWITIYFFLVPFFTAKWAVIALLLQIHGTTAKWRRYLLLTIGFIAGAIGVITFALSLSSNCAPVKATASVERMLACVHHETLIPDITHGFVNASIDLFLALYPITIVWGLKLSFRTKLGIVILMGFGILPCVAAIIRAVQLYNAPKATDPTYQLSQCLLWGIIEVETLVIISAIPSLRPLALSFGHKVFGIPLPSTGYATTNKSGTAAMRETGASNGNRTRLEEKSSKDMGQSKNLDISTEEVAV